MSVMADTHQSAMGPYVAVAVVGSALNAWTAVSREALVVKVFRVVQATSGGLGEGGGGEGDGSEGDGDGGSRQVFRHFRYFFLHSLLHCFFPTASTPAKKSTEMRSSISFIVSAHEGDGASDAGRFERKRAAIAHRRTSQPKGHSQSAVAGWYPTVGG